MRYRTAIILATVLIAGMFILEAVMRSVLERWVEQGVEIPVYGRILLSAAVFCGQFKWFLIPLVFVGLLFEAVLTRRPSK